MTDMDFISVFFVPGFYSQGCQLGIIMGRNIGLIICVFGFN